MKKIYFAKVLPSTKLTPQKMLIFTKDSLTPSRHQPLLFSITPTTFNGFDFFVFYANFYFC